MIINNKIIFFAAILLATPLHAAENQPDEVLAPALEEGFTASYLAGQFASRHGDIATAIYYLSDVHRKDPANLEIARQLEGFLLLNGDIEEATRLADTIQKTGAKDPISALLLCLRAVKKNDIVSAQKILNESFSNASGQLWLPLVSSWLAVSERKLDKPITMALLNADAGRAAAVVNYHLALINAKAGFVQEAAVNFRDAIDDIDSPPSRVMAQLVHFYDNNGQPEILKSIVDVNRDALGDISQTKTTFATAAEGVAEVLFTMGSIMLSANIDQDAVIYLRLALYLRPDFPTAALTLGDAYGQLQQYEKANQSYALIRPSSNLYINAQVNIAINYERLSKYNEALAVLDSVIHQRPQSYESLVIKADILRGRNQLEEAVVAYTQAIKRIGILEDQHWSIFFARGATYERLKKFNEAEQDLQQALKLLPDQPDVLNYLGYIWLTNGRNVKEAQNMIATALTIKPNDPQIIDSMGWAYYLTGEYAKAAKYLEKAVDMIPSDPTVNDHLGDVYWQQGRKTEARYQWERSLTFTKEEAAANIIRQKLLDGVEPPALAWETPPVVASQQLQNAPAP